MQFSATFVLGILCLVACLASSEVDANCHHFLKGECFKCNNSGVIITKPKRSFILELDKIQTLCNGKSECFVDTTKIRRPDEFTYDCIPTLDPSPEKYNIFDICQNKPKTLIINATSGYIRSPYYPYYYKNNQRCSASILLNNKKIHIYVLTLNMPISLGTNELSDYIDLDGRIRLSGYYPIPKYMPISKHIKPSQNQVRLNFYSDWLTKQPLKPNKGFTIYFELF